MKKFFLLFLTLFFRFQGVKGAVFLAFGLAFGYAIFDEIRQEVLIDGRG